MPNIGWIEWVEKTDLGVNVHFFQERTVRVVNQLNKNRQEVVISSIHGKKFDYNLQFNSIYEVFLNVMEMSDEKAKETANQIMSESDSRETFPYLSLTVGDEFYSHNTPSDTAHMKVIVENGVVGVHVQAFFKGHEASAFIPASVRR